MAGSLPVTVAGQEYDVASGNLAERLEQNVGPLRLGDAAYAGNRKRPAKFARLSGDFTIGNNPLAPAIVLPW